MTKAYAETIAKQQFIIAKMYPVRALVPHDLQRCAERANTLALYRTAQVEKPDPEKLAMKAEIDELRAALADTLGYMRRMQLEQTPSVSFLDEMMASLEAKPDAVTPVSPTEFSQSFVDALLAPE